MSDISDIDGEEEKAPAIWGIVLQYVIAVVCFIGEDIGLFSVPDGIGWSIWAELVTFIGLIAFLSLAERLSRKFVPLQHEERSLRKYERLLTVLAVFSFCTLSAYIIEKVWERLA